MNALKIMNVLVFAFVTILMSVPIAVLVHLLVEGW